MNVPLISNINFINKRIKIPKLTVEKKIRIIFLIVITIFMIINDYSGIAIAQYKVSCIKDWSHIITNNINIYFLNHPISNKIIKLIFSISIDFTIVYTLIVWSIYSTNIRLLSSGISYMFFNFLCRFIHVQIQPTNPSFYENYFFSIFINYHKSTYSFYPIIIGLLIICALEWKRNYNNCFFCFIIFLSIGESFLLIALKGNYFHEIFTSAITGHYFFIINEAILITFFGEDYLKIENINNNELNNDDIELLSEKSENVKIELINYNKYEL